MIWYGALLRLSDGTPLSATTDNTGDASLSAARRVIKLLAPRLAQQASRVCLQEDDYTIHCIHNVVVGFVAVCEPNYSHLLAYSFLDELCKEFNTLYTASVVAAVRRPYAFIEFDGFLEKVRQKYNSPRCVAARVNLPELRAELSMRPPVFISASDLDPPSPGHSRQSSGPHTSLTMPNGNVPNGVTPANTQVGVSAQLSPLSMSARSTVLVAGLLMLLDAYRGLVALSQSSLEDYDGPSPLHGFGFLLELSLLLSQVHVLKRYHRFRKLWSVACVVVVVLLTLLLLGDFRDPWLSFTYLCVCGSLGYHTVTRNFRKLNRFNV